MPGLSNVDHETLLDTLPVTVFRIGRDYRIDFVNRYGADQYGRSPAEILGRNCSELGMPADLYELWHREIDICFDTGAPGEFEYFRTYTTPQRLIEFHLAPEKNDSGRVERVLVAMMTIDKVHQLRKALDAQEELFRSFMDNSPVIAWLRDSEGRYEFLNKTYLDRFHLKAEDLIGHTPRDVWPTEVAEQFLHNDRAVRMADKPMRAIVNVPEVDGQICNWLNVNFPFVNGDGKAYVGGVGLDVTVERKAEARMAQAQKLESLGLFAAGAAHDFNNLLTAVIGHAGLARIHSGSDPVLSDHFRAIEDVGHQMAELCQQMLSYAGRNRRDVRSVNLNNLAQDTVRLLRSVLPRQVAVRFDLAADLPNVPGDITQLRQIMMNLLMNAAEALADNPGTITLESGIEIPSAVELENAGYTDSPKAHVALFVRDDGVGMTADVQAKIFEPFYSTKANGRGLGLAAVQGIVRAHHGLVSVASTPGNGTTFKVLLPIGS